jgi:hypothetical protein
MKPLLKTRKELEASGYIFAGAAKCRGCGTDIFWFMTPLKKRAPFQWSKADPSLLESHWVSCPQAKEFRKGKPWKGK